MAKDKASTRKPRRRNARARDDGGTRRATEATPPVRASKRLSVQVSAAASAFLVNFRLRLDAIASIFVNYHEERQEFAKTEAADLIEQNLLIQFVVLPRKMGTGRDSLETDENVVTCFIDGAATLKRARKQGLLRPVAPRPERARASTLQFDFVLMLCRRLGVKDVFLFATEAGAPAWLTLGFEHVGSSASLIHLRFDLLFKRDRGVSRAPPAVPSVAPRSCSMDRAQDLQRLRGPLPHGASAVQERVAEYGEKQVVRLAKEAANAAAEPAGSDDEVRRGLDGRAGARLARGAVAAARVVGPAPAAPSPPARVDSNANTRNCGELEVPRPREWALSELGDTMTTEAIRARFDLRRDDGVFFCTAPGRAEVQIKELGFHFVDPLAPIAEKEIVPRPRLHPYLGIEGWISITSRGPASFSTRPRASFDASRASPDAPLDATVRHGRARAPGAMRVIRKFANAIARKAAEARGETFVPTPYDETAVDAVVVTAVPPVAPVVAPEPAPPAVSAPAGPPLKALEAMTGKECTAELDAAGVPSKGGPAAAVLATLVADGAKKVVFQYVGAKKGSANGTDYLVARWRGLAETDPLRLEFDELARRDVAAAAADEFPVDRLQRAPDPGLVNLPTIWPRMRFPSASRLRGARRRRLFPAFRYAQPECGVRYPYGSKLGLFKGRVGGGVRDFERFASVSSATRPRETRRLRFDASAARNFRAL
ncbi:hypothetical protein JL721_10566 [Aureococcus anophagefferens]|nr:hypothetical protein JL721_10566 [Aureococcus anophagefferens]